MTKRYKTLLFVFFLCFGAVLAQGKAFASSQTDYFDIKTGRNGYFQHSANSEDFLYYLNAGGYNNSLNVNYGTTTFYGVPYWDSFPNTIWQQRYNTSGFNSIFTIPIKVFVLADCEYNAQMVFYDLDDEYILHYITATSSPIDYIDYNLCWFAYDTATTTMQTIKHFYFQNVSAFDTFIVLVSQENDLYNFDDIWSFLTTELAIQENINDFITFGSWGTSTPPINEPSSDYCQNMSFAVKPFCNMLVWLFVPNGSIDAFSGLGGAIKYKPPFGYFFAYYDEYSNLTTTTPAVSLESVDAIQDNIFDPVKTGLSYILWLFCGLYIIIFISKHVHV